MHFVKEIGKVEPFKLQLKFEDGTLRTIDFREKLFEWSISDHSIYKTLLEPEYFREVRYNKELETIYWDNGVDFCPEMLYEWSNK